MTGVQTCALPIWAIDAMNLDGGGSTEFAVNGQLVNDASSSPLRPVGDTIEVVPASARNR